jgi:hypothetical protein
MVDYGKEVTAYHFVESVRDVEFQPSPQVAD